MNLPDVLAPRNRTMYEYSMSLKQNESLNQTDRHYLMQEGQIFQSLQRTRKFNSQVTASCSCHRTSLLEVEVIHVQQVHLHANSLHTAQIIRMWRATCQEDL